MWLSLVLAPWQAGNCLNGIEKIMNYELIAVIFDISNS
jgi:hypothetical protein